MQWKACRRCAASTHLVLQDKHKTQHEETRVACNKHSQQGAKALFDAKNGCDLRRQPKGIHQAQWGQNRERVCGPQQFHTSQ